MTPEERIELTERLPYGASLQSPLRPDHWVVDELVKWIDSRQSKAVAAEREALVGPVSACGLCGAQYPDRFMHDLRAVGGANKTCLECCGRLDERETQHSSGWRAAASSIAGDIRARGSVGPVIQHTEKTAEAADIPMEWLRCPASKPDDVDRPADHPSNWTSGPIVDLGGEG